MIIQAHRGAGNLAPENTMEAFRISWEMGVIPEADLRTTKDAVIVAFHDHNFSRLVTSSKLEIKQQTVADLNWHQLAQLDVGSYWGQEFAGAKVPTVMDIFSEMKSNPDYCLYIDYKDIDLQELANIVLEFDLKKQIILSSCQHEILKKWQGLLPEADTLIWMGGNEKEMTDKINSLKEKEFDSITQLQVHCMPNEMGNKNPFKVSAEFIIKTAAVLQQYGILFQALPWELKDEFYYLWLLERNVQSIATDFPKVVKEIVDGNTMLGNFTEL